MIHEYAEAVPDDYKVSVPAVHAYVRYPVCPKCGGTLGAGLFIVRRLLLAFGRCAQQYAWCRGDQNSQVQMPTIDIVTGQLGTVPMSIPCFGVYKEHIHCTCGRCGFMWLMDCKGGE